MASLNHLKNNNHTHIRTLISVGGWNFNKYTMSQLMLNNYNRKRFVDSSLRFALLYGFDGVDLDFEYPSGRQKQQFTKLVKLMRSTFDNYCSKHYLPRMLVTAAVAAGKGNIDNGYEVAEISKYLDFINVMTYDLHGGWDHYTGFVGPMYPKNVERGFRRQLNIDWVVKYWLALGCPKHKLVIGIPLYGRGFQLTNARHYQVGAKASGVSPPGRYTREAGYLSYYEICKHYAPYGRVIWDDEQKSTYVVKGRTWIGYDTPRSAWLKALYVKEHDLGGWMVWSLALDDFSGSFCGKGKYPLLKSINSVNLDSNLPDTTIARTTTTLGPTDKYTDPSTTTVGSGPFDGIPNKSDFCLTKPNGLYAVRHHCYVFCRCFLNASYWFVCPSKLIFNPLHSYCDYSYNIRKSDMDYCSP